MQRVLILGGSGSGKSTLARQMAERLGLPLIHLDREYWRPDWVATPDDEFDQIVADLVRRPRWIMDGNYGRTLDLRLRHADTAIHLDFARWRCLLGVSKRIFRSCNFSHPRPDMTEGCGERWDWEFIEWIWDFRKSQRPKTLRCLAEHGSRVSNVTLRSPGEIRRFLDQFEEGQRIPGAG